MATYDCVIYLSSLPKIADRTRKTEVLESFATGCKNLGLRTLLQTQHNIVESRLAVILGWVGTKLSGQHIQLRRSLIDHQRQTKNYIMPIDSSCFKFVDTNSKFLRYSLNGVFYNTDNYANQNSNSDQWQLIQKTFPQLDLKSWRTEGNHILLCLQRDGGWSMKGADLNLWAQDTVQNLRKLTNRPIRIRPHPKARNTVTPFLKVPGVSISEPGISLQKDLEDAWASVFYNSSSSVASILAGVPVFATDSDCVAWNVANPSIKQIESPIMPQREQWLYDLASCHWSDQQSQQGLIYKKFQQFF
jgi:hypothetical protein